MFRFSFTSARKNPRQLRRVFRRHLNWNRTARANGYPIGIPRGGNIPHSRQALCCLHWLFPCCTFVLEEQGLVSVWRRRQLRYLPSPEHLLHRFGYWRDIAAHPGPTAREECGARINISPEGAVGRAPRDSSQEPVIRFFSTMRGLATFPTTFRLSQDPTNCICSSRPRAARLLPRLMWR